MTTIMDAAFDPIVPNGPASHRTAPTKRRHKTEKELYQEAMARAHSLRDRLEARRVQNREQFVEDLYRLFAIQEIDGDFDDSERIERLRSRLAATK
jgi:hypothetical protein